MKKKISPQDALKLSLCQLPSLQELLLYGNSFGMAGIKNLLTPSWPNLQKISLGKLTVS